MVVLSHSFPSSLPVPGQAASLIWSTCLSLCPPTCDGLIVWHLAEVPFEWLLILQGQVPTLEPSVSLLCWRPPDRVPGPWFSLEHRWLKVCIYKWYKGVSEQERPWPPVCPSITLPRSGFSPHPAAVSACPALPWISVYVSSVALNFPRLGPRHGLLIFLIFYGLWEKLRVYLMRWHTSALGRFLLSMLSLVYGQVGAIPTWRTGCFSN